jgi:hypothetical protein
MSFSAACKAQHIFDHLSVRLELCPDTSCNLYGILQAAHSLLIRQENSEIAFPAISAKDAEMAGAP